MTPPSDLAGASLIDALFGVKLSQHARLLTIATSQDSALPQALVAERFTGREAVNELFDIEVDALSTSTDLDLTSFIGEELTITLLQADGTRRAWHGLCLDAAWRGTDGGMARYRLHLQPALALLGLRRDSYIFQDKDARDLIGELLADYPQVRFSFDVSQELPVRPIWTQYRESDLEFLQRVLATEGLSWRFEHDQEGDAAPEGGAQARHSIVFFDSKAAIPATPGGDTLRFHGVRATDVDDAIDRFAALRRVSANAVTISSWDPTRLLAPASEQLTSLDIGELPSLPIYDGSAERRHENKAGADAHSRVMLQALELENKQFEGAGAVRRMAAGHGFQLTQHEGYAGGSDRFTALWVQHEARNNLEPALGGALARLAGLVEAGISALLPSSEDALEPGTYRNRFGCVRDAVAIVPRASAARFSGAALGPQTALVVGLPETLNTTTREHQVRIQFAWQRGVGAISGGLTHDTDDKGNAPGNDASGTWVRVAEALAGPNWGSQFTPRIGTEVLVDFIEGDMDRPLVVAQLYTGSDTPPFSAGVDTEINHAGVISGMHSNNFDGGGFNQWVLDDTGGQLRTRLATSSAGTQLNLGYLVQQAAGSAQRGAYRGNGFELRTDAWAVLRGGEGVLMSSTARRQQGSGVTSTQLDSAEAIGLLRGAGELGTNLLDAATGQKALSSKEALQAQVEMIEQIDPEQKGKFTGGVGGQDALKAATGARDVDASAPVEKFGAPIVLLDAPSSINWATPASTVLFAGGQLQWTTQADLHMAAAYTVAAVSANATGLFTHEGGIQAVAANGPVSLQAHTDQLEILADKAVTIVSVNDVIEIKASEKIVLQAGQSSVTLEGGNITFACPGNFSVKGGQHIFQGGSSPENRIESLPDSRVRDYDEAFVIKDRDSGEPLSRQPYQIQRADGTREHGFTDERGLTHLVSAAEIETISVSLLSSPHNSLNTNALASPKAVPSKFSKVASSTTSPTSIKQRKEVVVKRPLCWIEDHQAEISVNSERYSDTTTLAGVSRNYTRPIRYKIDIPLKSNGNVVVELRIKIVHAPDAISDLADSLEKDAAKILQRQNEKKAILDSVKSSSAKGLDANWNKKLSVKITDPECGERIFAISYKVTWVEIDQHYTMKVHKNSLRENVDGDVINVSGGTSEWTHAHEFAHCFGLPDEYGYDAVDDDYVVYIKPDGSRDTPILAPITPVDPASSNATIMSAHSSTKIKLRHAWQIAIEVQDVLRKKIGRKIICDTL